MRMAVASGKKRASPATGLVFCELRAVAVACCAKRMRILLSETRQLSDSLNWSSAARNAVGLPLVLVWKSFGEPDIRGSMRMGAT